MTTCEVKKYTPEFKKEWDNFVKISKNGSFLFYRDFMEYHSDRFSDFSLMIFRKNKLIALLPAHRKDGLFSSHNGLTYGGFIFKDYTNVTTVEEVFNAVLKFLKEENFTQIKIKIMPKIYQGDYSSAVDFLLFKSAARLVNRNLTFVLDFGQPLKTHKNKLKIYNKAYIRELEIKKDDSLAVFWNEVLVPVLDEKHDSEPVHSLEEIELLQKRFPKNIRQFNVYLKGEVVAGMMLFIHKNIAKSQYGAATFEGQKYKALDYLYLQLFKELPEEGFRYFDLGITNEGDGTDYNKGLTSYKEELGGTAINQDTYLLDL